MELHEHLYALGLQVGRGVFDDPDGFRGVLDDFLDEDDATTGDINLLVDAVRLGAYASMLTTLDSGGDAARAVEEAGARLARDRGSADAAGARWACAVLGFAVGRVGEADVARFRTQIPGPGGRPTAGPTPGPAQDPAPAPAPTRAPPVPAPGPSSYPPQVSYPPPVHASYQPPAASWPSPTSPPPRRSSRGPLIGVVATVVAVAVAVGLALVVAGGGDDNPAAADTSSRPDASEPTTEPVTDPVSSDPVTTSAPAVDRISDEAAAGYTTALLSFSGDFTEGADRLSRASTQDDSAEARAAVLSLREASYDLDLAVRALDLTPIQPTVNQFLEQSGVVIAQLDEIYATATTALDVNLGVASLPSEAYTSSFEAVQAAIDENRATS